MPVTCNACGMRQFCVGEVKTYETHWNRLGISNSPHLSEAQAMSRVCRHNKSPGCLTKGLPMPEPEPGLEPFLNDAERLELAEEIYGKIGGEFDAA